MPWQIRTKRGSEETSWSSVKLALDAITLDEAITELILCDPDNKDIYGKPIVYRWVRKNPETTWHYKDEQTLRRLSLDYARYGKEAIFWVSYSKGGYITDTRTIADLRRIYLK